MDELVAVGLAGILGLLLFALALAGAVFLLGSSIWSAFSSGNYPSVAVHIFTLLTFIAIYTGAGLWLQKTGRI